jgi:hypothetical protein
MKALRLMALVLCAMSGAAWTANGHALLEQAANRAIDSLGKPDGYFGNPEVRIPLPGRLEKLRKVLQPLGASKEVDALVLAMNRAAETALPECRALVATSIRDMPLADEQQADAELVQNYRMTMSDRLATEMLPIIGKATKDVHLAKSYNDVAGKASALGVLDQRDADLDAYVTRKTLDGLFKTMGKEQTALRAGK